MNQVRLNLVVLRVADVERSAAFYGQVGLAFKKHAHGSGLMHYAAESSEVVFELYPATSGQPVTASARIGFDVPDVDGMVDRLVHGAGAALISAPKDSEWGRRAVVADPDGHRVELTTRAERTL